MSNRFKNWFSYTVFHLSSHKGLFLAILADLTVLIYSIIDDYYRSIDTQKIVLSMMILTKIFLVWQIYSFFKQRFDIYKNVDPGGEDKIKFPESSKKYRVIKNDDYGYSLDEDYPILRNHKIDAFLLDETKALPVNVQKEKNSKTERMKKYYSYYENTLLYFLNKKWKHSNYLNGEFVNDKKICFSSEPSVNSDPCEFNICPGRYYYGYMTNSIYCRRITSNIFEMKAPWNYENHTIESYNNSFFSDHIGVSTLAVFTDNNNQRYVLIFQQSSSAGKSAMQLCPTGSGSMDWSDYKSKDKGDFKKTIISAAEREFREECKISKGNWKEIKGKPDSEQTPKQEPKQKPEQKSEQKPKLIQKLLQKLKPEPKQETKQKDKLKINTKIIAFYKDLRYGGKPEFCCVTEIDGTYEYFTTLAYPNGKELSDRKKLISLNEDGWKGLLKEKDDNGEHMVPSLALKVNFKLAMDYYKELDKKREATPLIS